jgi:alanine racemase
VNSSSLRREAYLSYLEIDLGAVSRNYAAVSERLKSGTAYFVVIKADAYGHGAVEIARTLENTDAVLFCVARVEEALELRNAGIRKPLLIFASPFRAQAELALAADSHCVFCAKEHIDAIAAAAKATGRNAQVHMKIDTGMGRLGVAPQSALELLHYAKSLHGITVVGVMSHFASADSDRATTEAQIRVFSEIRDAIRQAGIEIQYFHIANSAGLLDYPQAHFDAVRVGVLTYGLYPAAAMKNRISLTPSMTMKTKVVFLKDVPQGQGLSYNHTFRTSRPMRIATVPIGYADGYPRHASNSAYMLAGDNRSDVVGRVCMDLTLLDVSGLPVQIGDEVTAFGKTDTQVLYAEDVAESFGSISYELCTRVGKRLPKFFV